MTGATSRSLKFLGFFLLCLFFDSIALVVAEVVEDSVKSQQTTSGESQIETLLSQAQQLFVLGKPIDARSLLTKALVVAPDDYRPHMLLGGYYLGEVGHFTLAYRHIKSAESLFNKKYGLIPRQEDPSVWRQHARLLYLLSEAELNLDNYSASLQTLDRFSQLYWDDWFPGTKAWVLMKLKRIDEAVQVAQAGLLRGAEPGRTFNILGILLSVKGNRELSLQAFNKAIQAELAQGNSGQVATPLNNAGEVFRELFQDERAEAAWRQALQLRDGCEHILPSLNLTILYIDELRLLQAERTLNDFEACYAAQSTRADTEHRTLLALARGRIALRKGDYDQAVSDLTLATERQQWFGKIGTNANDVRFAAHIALAQALAAKAEALSDVREESWINSFQNRLEIPWLRLRSWWLFRQSRDVALNELNDFEDLYIRHTDTMLEYPTLGRMLAYFPRTSLQHRLHRLMQTDSRASAKVFYDLYLATNMLSKDSKAVQEKLESFLAKFRERDRLARAETLSLLLINEEQQRWPWQARTRDKNSLKKKEELFSLLPSALRYSEIRLPVTAAIQSSQPKLRNVAEDLLQDLTETRFELVKEPLSLECRYQLQIHIDSSSAPGEVVIGLVDRYTNKTLASSAINLDESEKRDPLWNDFMKKVFSHKSDPATQPVARFDLLKGLMEQ